MARPVVGILYPGEMGSAIGKLLRQQGFQVVTTVAGRSERTKRLCAAAGFDVLKDLGAVATCADIVLSLVCPQSAVAVAEEYCSVRTDRQALYVDLNSIAPGTALRVREICSAAGVEFVDGAVHGLAAQLQTRGIIYLSGPAADQIEGLFAGIMRTRVLSAEPGDASTFRMLISGITKGVNALFMEVALAARKAELLDPLIDCCREVYPGVLSIVERILPTYPRHAPRRAEEMREAEQTLLHLGMQPHMLSAAREVIAEMGQKLVPENDNDWSIPDVIKELHNHEVLALPEPCLQ